MDSLCVKNDQIRVIKFTEQINGHFYKGFQVPYMGHKSTRNIVVETKCGSNHVFSIRGRKQENTRSQLVLSQCTSLHTCTHCTHEYNIRLVCVCNFQLDHSLTPMSSDSLLGSAFCKDGFRRRKDRISFCVYYCNIFTEKLTFNTKQKF